MLGRSWSARAWNGIALAAALAVLTACSEAPPSGEVSASPSDDATPIEGVEPAADPAAEPASSPPSSPADAPACLPDAVAAAVGPEAAPTLVAVVGDGDRGVVLAPQNGGTWCQWAAEAQRLVDAGYRVATFTWATDDVASVGHAVAALASAGATGYALVGASRGGTAVAAAADGLTPVAVVALSPPAEFGAVDGSSASSGYDGPLLVVASEGDTGTPPDASRAVARDDASFLQVPGRAHGVALLVGDAADDVRAAIDATLAAGFGG